MSETELEPRKIGSFDLCTVKRNFHLRWLIVWIVISKLIINWRIDNIYAIKAFSLLRNLNSSHNNSLIRENFNDFSPFFDLNISQRKRIIEKYIMLMSPIHHIIQTIQIELISIMKEEEKKIKKLISTLTNLDVQ